MSQPSYRLLLNNIGRNITKENVKLIRFLCSDLVPHGRDLPTPLDLLLYFEECGYINDTDMSFLAEVLYRTNRHDLLKMLPGVKNRRDYERNFLNSAPLNFSPYRLACFRLAVELTLDELEQLKSLSKNELSVYNYQRSTDPITFFICLEEEDLLSPEDLEFLVDILSALDNRGPLKMIQDLREDPTSSCVRDFTTMQISHQVQPSDSTPTAPLTPSSRFFDDSATSSVSARFFTQDTSQTHCYREGATVTGDIDSLQTVAVAQTVNEPVQPTAVFPPTNDVQAKVIPPFKKLESGKLVRASSTRKATSDDVVESDSYKMDKCGLCIVINNEKFEENINYDDAVRRLKSQHELNRVVPNIGFSDREGSAKDVTAIKNLFAKLGFDVRVHENLGERQMLKTLDVYAQMDHTNYDSFVCFIMTHGLEGCVYGVDGHSIGVSRISKCFRPNNCPTLVDKPKIFFFQACQGENAMKGARLRQEGDTNLIDEPLDLEHDSPPLPLPVYDIPLEADFLIAHSTVPGYLAYRSRSEGSWFIKTLVDCVEQYHDSDDLLSILIRVNNHMSRRPLKQMPMPIATLRKKIFLRQPTADVANDTHSFTAVATNDRVEP